MSANNSHPDMVTAISDQLIDARRNAALLLDFPCQVPETLEQAYAIQNRSRQLWDDDVAGWKVGGVPPSFADKFEDKKLVGPIFRGNVYLAEEGEVTEFPVFSGFAAVEAEFVFVLGETAEQDCMHIGVEMASSPVSDLNGKGPAAIVSDFGSNGGLILGPEITGWRELSAEAVWVKTEIDGEVVGEKNVSTFPADALTSLKFCREHAARYGIELAPGTFISSGAITGVHDAHAGQFAIADFGTLGCLKIQLTSASADS